MIRVRGCGWGQLEEERVREKRRAGRLCAVRREVKEDNMVNESEHRLDTRVMIDRVGDATWTR